MKHAFAAVVVLALLPGCSGNPVSRCDPSACSGCCKAEGECASCGADACTPTTCAQLGKNCGSIDDGCGTTLECGTCLALETCGGAGTANVCGQAPPCTPTSCAAQGKNCGAISDGCSAMLACGKCVAPEACGAAGVQNVCGNPSEAGSAADYPFCNTAGWCFAYPFPHGVRHETIALLTASTAWMSASETLALTAPLMASNDSAAWRRVTTPPMSIFALAPTSSIAPTGQLWGAGIGSVRRWDGASWQSSASFSGLGLGI